MLKQLALEGVIKVIDSPITRLDGPMNKQRKNNQELAHPNTWVMSTFSLRQLLYWLKKKIDILFSILKTSKVLMMIINEKSWRLNDDYDLWRTIEV